MGVVKDHDTHLAEVPEVMLAHKVSRCLPHALNVQAAGQPSTGLPLQYEVLIMPVPSTKPVQQKPLSVFCGRIHCQMTAAFTPGGRIEELSRLAYLPYLALNSVGTVIHPKTLISGVRAELMIWV